MADGDDNSQPRTRRASSSDDSEPDVDAIALDLVNLKGDRTPKRAQPDHNLQPSGAHEPSVKKEDNPFSFRHFLHTDRSYQNQGARPKVYCEGRQVTVATPNMDMSGSDRSSRITEYPSALPDFVQDHLVIEQCYLNKNGNYNTDTNLPDFTLDRNSNSRNDEGNGMKMQMQYRPQAEFPLDLPMSGEPQIIRNSPQPAISEVGNSKSLPDFLADGAVRNQQDNEGVVSSSPEWESDRLRIELDTTRRQLMEQTRRADCLSHELEMARNKEHEYTQNLAKALEQVEENLERSKIRASSSECNIMKLRQEVKLLNKEISRLKKENVALRNGDGASGGPCSSLTNRVDSTAQRHLAQDLRTAASTAEHSLRQLLSGVDNLRMLATRVENLSRYEERKTYNSDEDVDEDEDAGPAL